MTPIQTFLADHRLTELAELCKTSDSLLSLFDLLENQHSDLLAWCLSPNEGHGLGDGVVKDLLLAASIAASQLPKLAAPSLAFLTKWTPGRIRNTSFGSAFVVRELGIQTSGDKGRRKGRLDLFLVDPVNQLLVVIENKTGSALTKAQLDGYKEAVRGDLKPLNAFKDFDCLLVVLDQFLDGVPPEADAWVGIDYSFLEPTAVRARAQVDRSNPAAKLVLEYCQQHIEEESPEEDRIGELAAELALDFPGVMDALKTMKRHSIKEWAAASFDSDERELALFNQQHKELTERLIEKSGISAIASRVLREVPGLLNNEEHVEQGRTSVSFTVKALGSFHDDVLWPVYVYLYRHAELSAQGQDVYVGRLCFAPDALNDATPRQEFAQGLRKCFPSIKAKTEGRATFKTLRKGLTAEEAIQFAVSTLRKLDEFLREASKR